MNAMTTGWIAELVEGDLHGDGDVAIAAVRSLEAAGPQELSFLADEQSLARASRSSAGALITYCPVEGYGGVQIVCKDAELAVCRLLQAIRRERFPLPSGISQSAHISPSARLGESVAVGAFAVIEEGAVLEDGVTVYPQAYIGRAVRIGARTVVHPHATICDGVEIGCDCIIHPNCVLGDDGFGFIQRDGRNLRKPHVGSLRVGDSVEIGGLTSIDRGMVDDTVVADGVKIDKHSHIAHNCRIGDHSVLAGGALLAGSVSLGQGVLIAGRVAIADHRTIGDGAMLAGGSAVHHNVKPGETCGGYPARPMEQTKRIWALEARLPEMRREFVQLQQEVDSLKKRLADTS